MEYDLENLTPIQIEHIVAELSPLCDEDIEDAYNEMLDDCNESFKMGVLEYYPSDILRNCDPVAYRCGKADYIDAQIENYIYCCVKD